MIYRKTVLLCFLVMMNLGACGKDMEGEQLSGATLITHRQIPSLDESSVDSSNPNEIKERSSWKRAIQVISRYKGPIVLGVITVGGICYAASCYYTKYPPFDAQVFANAYDSSQTGLSYNHFSYAGHPLPLEIRQRNWCLPNGDHFRWHGEEWSYCPGQTSYFEYIDPIKYPPQRRFGTYITVCNKTTADAAAFLRERCGFNFNFWKSVFDPYNDWESLDRVGHTGDHYYCNPHPSNKTLICAQVEALMKRIDVKSISQITLVDVGHFYNSLRAAQGRFLGGVIGVNLSLLSLGLLFWG